MHEAEWFLDLIPTLRDYLCLDAWISRAGGALVTTGGAAILTFLLPKGYMLYQLLKFKTYFTIQLSYMWTG